VRLKSLHLMVVHREGCSAVVDSTARLVAFGAIQGGRLLLRARYPRVSMVVEQYAKKARQRRKYQGRSDG
jgi:hypothetical protein